MELLKEFSLGGVSLDLAQHLLERLHLGLDLTADLLFLFFQLRIFGVVRLE